MPVLLTVRILLWRARPALVLAGCLLLAVGAARVLTSPSEAGVPVVVAAHQVDVGSALAAADLRTVSLPAEHVPAGSAAEPSELVGRVLGISVPAGLPIVASLLTEGRFSVDPPPGTVVVPVRVDMASVLEPGDRVDLVGSGCEAAGVVASSVLVVDLSDDAVLVAATSGQAADLLDMRDPCLFTTIVAP